MIRTTTRLKAIGGGGVMLYLPAHVRDELGVKAGDPVVLEAKRGTLSVSRDWFR